MLKFFRRFRQNLLSEGKTKKYLLYAIGEIVLVVIGILIALQVSNWNKNRIGAQEEQKIIKNINAEFKLNKQVLSNSITDNQNSIRTGRHIMNLMNTKVDYLKTKNTDSLIFEVFENGGVNITENSILETLQSGKLQTVKNDKLKSLIFDWTQKKNKAIERRTNLNGKEDKLVDYLTKKYPLKNIDAYGVLQWETPSTIVIDKYQIFYDIEFENIVDDFLFNLVNYNADLKDLLVTVNNIIENSKTD